MPFPQWSAGQRITAELLNQMTWDEVTQNSRLTVNNITGYQNTNLVLPADPNGQYRYLLLPVTSSSTDIKINWEVPGTGTVDRYGIGPGSNATGGAGDLSSMSARLMTASTDWVMDGATNTVAMEHGMIVADSSGGDFIVQFSQNTQDASDSHFEPESRLLWVRVG